MKTPYQLFFCLVLTSLAALPAPAKPLSYVGGTMVMQENDDTGNMLSIDYTFHPHFALALYAKRDIGEKEFYTIGPQLNTLIKRWNLPEGQGNIFGMTGVGMARQGSKSEPAAWAAFLADYETRRVFLSYEPRLTYSGDIEKAFSQRAPGGGGALPGRLRSAQYLARASIRSSSREGWPFRGHADDSPLL